jgi:uncharacterized protein (DUF2235 family)
MRRLLIFCDGTWNKETTGALTNVVTSAQVVKPVGDDGVDQIVCYIEGVGTTFVISRLETIVAGAFGWGLFDRIADAYRFLVFNYQPGDEIFIFGFSRGAFTARSLGGLIRKCGIIPKSEAGKIGTAYDFYRRGDVHPDSPIAQQYRALHSPNTIMKDLDREWRRQNGYVVPDVPNFTIRYLGVWDTVGELGIPKYLLLGNLLNQKYQFHDLDLSSTVVAARQALAIDEDRLEFEPTRWDNLPTLNQIPGREGNYQQLWFPGDHGSVGGGGDVRGLSNATLAWVVQGAVEQGLALWDHVMQNWLESIDALAPLRNSTKPPGFADRFLYRHGPRHGPSDPYGNLGETTRHRLAYVAKSGDWQPYRPAALAELIEAYPDLLDEPTRH